MQWKEFLLGNRANKLLVWTETQGQICGAVGDVETHVLWENCIVKNQCICEDFQSDFFITSVFFLEDRKAWNDSVSLESYIMAEDVYARGHNIF